VRDIISGVYYPIIPIALTVYFFSNVARIEPPQPTWPAPPMPPSLAGAPPQAAVKFCPKCGARLDAAAAFCSSCGAAQSA